jgi:hypothetical protein
MADFFRIVVNPALQDAWFPDEPLTQDGQEIDAREFIAGKPYHGPRPWRVPLASVGRRTDFTLAAFDMPIVGQCLGDELEQAAPGAVQRFPVAIDSVASGYEILNICCTVECLDEHRSDTMRWEQHDGRPEKVGEYRMVADLTIDPLRAEGYEMFRLRGWEIALVVSDRIRRVLLGGFDLGIAFRPVS